MTITEEPATESPPRERRRWFSTPVLMILAVAALLASAGAFYAVVATGQDAQQTASTVAQDTAPAVLTLDTLCKRNDQLGTDLRAAGACGEKVDKAKSAVDGQPSPAVASPGLSREDVVAIVAGQLAGKVVTVDQVMNMVTQVYNANRPKDAPPPTGDQVLAAVQSVCGSTKCQGSPGVAGKDAPAVTDDQIFAQVTRYCSGTDAPCKGRPGDTGPQGVSVTRQYFARDDQGVCQTMVDFSDGRTGIIQGSAGDAACPAALVTPTP